MNYELRSKTHSDSDSSPEKSPIKSTVVKKRRSYHQGMYPSLDEINREATESPNKFDVDEEENAEDSIDNSEIHNHETSRNRSKRMDRTPIHFTLESATMRSTSPNQKYYKSHDTSSDFKKTPTTKHNSNTALIFAAIAIALIIVAGVVLACNSASKKPTPEKQKSCPDFMKLSEEFPRQDERLFRSLKSGIESFRDGYTSVFSLFSTDDEIMKTLMFRIVNLTKECLESSQDPVSLGQNDISLRKIGDYRTELQQRSIMIVNNVNYAPVSEVQVLHSVCDTENPLVRPSVIFLTIKVPYAPRGGTKHIDFFHNYLQSQWSSLKENIRDPLIARILDQPFFVNPQ